ncbi:hypothetical protein FRC06_002123 [Ceratobasidium sp. 370]|nr:hypothetical protein FRC06_002123 [Ceratobasidium sp. 370]
MGHLFMIVRLGLFALVFAGAGVVLGICANLATHLLPTGLHDFLLFSLVVSALTIVVFILLALRSQPRIDAAVLFILRSGSPWGHTLKTLLDNSFVTPLKDKPYLPKTAPPTVLAFSWANFVFLVLALIGLLTVAFKLYARGERDIWKNSMSDVELFQEKELPGPGAPVVYPPPPSNSGSGSGRGGHTFVYYPGSHSAPLQHQVIQQQPGHSVIIQNGQVTQVPGSVTSV